MANKYLVWALFLVLVMFLLASLIRGYQAYKASNSFEEALLALKPI